MLSFRQHSTPPYFTLRIKLLVCNRTRLFFFGCKRIILERRIWRKWCSSLELVKLPLLGINKENVGKTFGTTCSLVPLFVVILFPVFSFCECRVICQDGRWRVWCSTSAIIAIMVLHQVHTGAYWCTNWCNMSAPGQGIPGLLVHLV